MSTLSIARRFLSFYTKADTVYRIHSPFVYALVMEVLEDTRHFYAFSMIEPLRQAHLHNHQSIKVQDYGAGSTYLSSDNTRKVSDIAKTSLSSPMRSRMLFRIVNYFKPKTMLEMGTSLGISTLYQAAASLDGQLITLEGSPEIARLASQTFEAYKAPANIDLRIGQFEQTLVPALEDLQKVDYVFFDGNHQKEPTIAYFQECLRYAHENSVFVLDDIYWSEEMMEAWSEIRQHPSVTCTVDCFFVGMVFFRQNNATPQHYRIVPSWWKPWMMGFFR